MAYYTESAAGGLRAAIDDAIRDWPGVDARSTFGCPSYYADGTVFAVVSDQGLSLPRLPAADRPALAAAVDREVRPFEAGARTVASWPTVAASVDDVPDLVDALTRSYETARGARSGDVPSTGNTPD